ncbi:MAG: hypothetical protein KJO24_03315 [Gammaproteobacteria bacterium]|nr:hypothetical protein [Gammaproteobacteria bacterium]
MSKHVAQARRDVVLPQLDPTICLQVDAGLAYCGCESPSARLRQYLYVFQPSNDFDYQTLSLLIQVFNIAGDACPVWDELVQLELERDCGLPRVDYLACLRAVVERSQQLAAQPSAWSPIELSA